MACSAPRSLSSIAPAAAPAPAQAVASRGADQAAAETAAAARAERANARGAACRHHRHLRRAACSARAPTFAARARRCWGNERHDPARSILARHAARARRAAARIEALWQDCYDHALPAHRRRGALFDATAADAAEQLAASLLAELTPPWSRWFGLAPARPRGRRRRDAPPPRWRTRPRRCRAISTAPTSRSRCTRPSSTWSSPAPACCWSRKRRSARPPRCASPPCRCATRCWRKAPSGRLDTVFRAARLTRGGDRARAIPTRRLPRRRGEATPRRRAARASRRPGPTRTRPRAYAAVLADRSRPPCCWREGRFAESPFIAFRWLKAPGEIYGRGPVAKALPDIRTANKVVELVLKNASIAATGIWQAEDDGVLNPATVRLEPGAIIPKAPGQRGPHAARGAGQFRRLAAGADRPARAHPRRAARRPHRPASRTRA